MPTPTERERLTGLLEAAKREQKRCMGGVDPVGCVAAAKRIVELRNALRDDGGAFLRHINHALTHRL